MNKRRTNFFDDDYPLSGRQQQQLHTPPHSETVIHMADDEDEISRDDEECVPAPPLQGDASRHQSDTTTTTTIISSEMLLLGVRETERELNYIHALMINVVWKHLTVERDAVQGLHRQVSSKPPMSVEARRVQLSMSGEMGPSGAASRRNASTLLDASAATTGTSSISTKPFVPPSRNPSMPSLDPDAHARFNRVLYRAIVDSGYNRQTSRMVSSQASSCTSPQPQRKSLRATALERVTSEQNGDLNASHRRHVRLDVSKGSTISPRSSSPPVGISSVSLIVLQSARQRSLATLMLRTMRLRVHERRAALADVALRYQYYRQRRALRAWWRHTQLEKARRLDVQHCAVLHWKSYVVMRQESRHIVKGFIASVRCRLAATRLLQMKRARRCLEKWASCFTRRRTSRSMDTVADRFHAAQRESHPRYISVAPSDTRHSCLRTVFGYWKHMTECRLEAELAQWHYERSLQRRALRRIAAILPRCLSRQQQQQQCVAAKEEVVGGADADSAIPEMKDESAVGRRVRCIHVDAAPDTILKYKTACARRVFQSTAMSQLFCHWKDRYLRRRADRAFIHRTRAEVLRRWVSALARREEEHAEMRVAWHRWRARLHRRQLVYTADAVYADSLSRLALHRWRLRCDDGRAKRELLLRASLEHWRERAALRAGVAVLTESRRGRLFSHWHQRAEARVQRRTSLLVADTMRETVVLLQCMRWWALRAAEVRHVRLSSEVLQGLASERRRQTCFNKWRMKAFGPAPLPQPLPPAAGVAR